MGWRGRADICIEAWDEIREFVSKEDRPYCLKVFLEALMHDGPYDIATIRTQTWPELKLAFKLAEIDDGED